jgi:8-oxo-dGTP diphosphatase
MVVPAVAAAARRRLLSTSAAPAALTHPRVGVAATVFPRLPDGRVDVSRLVLIQRGRPPGAGAWVYPGGRQELGETLAQAAAREAAEEVAFASGGDGGPGLAVTVVDPAVPAYACTDVLHPAAADPSPSAALAYHYAIVHVLTCVDVPAGAALPLLQARSDAADAAWVDVSALVDEVAAGRRRQQRARSDGGSADAAPPPTRRAPRNDGAVCIYELQRRGVLVPLTIEVARQAVQQWALRGLPTVNGDGLLLL